MNILTIDLEEWFHLLLSYDVHSLKYESRIEENVDFLLEALQEHGFKATFFVVGWIARKHPQLIRRLQELGHEIASHSDKHELVHRQTKDEFRKDLYQSIETIESICGTKITAYRAPGFSIDRNLDFYTSCLAENGIEIDSSLTSCRTQYGGISKVSMDQPFLLKTNGIALKEFPINTAKIFNKRIIYTGGGYFRLLPIWSIQRLFRKSLYNMSYFHPRDFDTVQPRIDISILANVKRNIGLKRVRNKFKQLLASFDFNSIEEADELINWTKAPVVKIT